MHSLAFFPWWQPTRGLSIGEFDILPFERDGEPLLGDAELQRTVESLTEPYKESGDLPIQAAAVLRVGEHWPLDELDDEEISAAFRFAELVTVAGLSARTFFSQSGYCNRENFQLVVQRFDRPDKGVTLRSTRRDGYRLNYFLRSTYRVQRPHHLGEERSDLDEALLVALTRHQTAPEHERLYEAVAGFNGANTDREEIPDKLELVMLCGAFERLLNCKSGTGKELAQRFASAFVPPNALLLGECERLKAINQPDEGDSSVRELWMRKMFALRGRAAHGKAATQAKAPWTLREHLLLASFAFPLCLKLILRDAGAYSLTEDDEDKIEAFERLACAPDLFPTQQPGTMPVHPWTEILRETADALHNERIMPELTRIMDALGADHEAVAGETTDEAEDETES